MAEQRESARQKSAVAAAITSGHVRIDCTVVDVSRTGARARLGSAAFLGAECHLTVSLFSDPVPCRIVWRRGSELGLRFKVRPVRREAPGSRTRIAGRPS